MKTAFLFSGQGSQYPNMGHELSDLYSDVSHIYECGSDILGFDLKNACFNYDENELAKTAVSQPAIFVTSLVALKAAELNDLTFEAVAGHSLGEYAAMVASGILSLEDGFKVIKARAAAMQKCAEQQDGAMYAIIGLTSSEIEDVCNSIDGYVIPVNYNSPSQIVIAGESLAAESAAKIFTEMGKRAVKLNVSAAFHSKLMKPAADELLPILKSVTFNEPKVDFYCNLYGKKLEDFSDMPNYLANHLTSAVRFTDEILTMSDDGFDTFIELGPNKVLTGLVKRTLKGVNALNIEDSKTLTKTIETLNA